MPNPVSTIHITITDNESRHQLRQADTIIMEESQKTSPNPWQPKNEVQTLKGVAESPSPSSLGSRDNPSPMKSLSPMTSFFANGASMQLHSPTLRSGSKLKDNHEMNTYTSGLYVSLENKNANLISNYAGTINLSSKLNLDFYKQQNQIKSPTTSKFQAEFQPAKLPTAVYSPMDSKTSSPRHSAQGFQVMNMEGQINRGVHGSQLKSVKKEQELNKLKHIALEEEEQPKLKRRPNLLNFPGVVQIQCAGQTGDFKAQLSGTTVPLIQKPLNVYRQKMKRGSVGQQKSNNDIQKVIDKRQEAESKTGRTSILQKQAGQFQTHTTDYEAEGRYALQQFTNGNSYPLNSQSRYGAAVSVQDQSFFGPDEIALHDQSSQIQVLTADSENNYLAYSKTEHRNSPTHVTGIKYSGSQMTFYEDNKAVEHEHRIHHVAQQHSVNRQSEIARQKQNKLTNLQLQKLNILQQLELSEQAYMTRFPPTSLSPSPKQIKANIRNAQIGLQKFTAQHAKHTQESMQRLMKLIQAEDLQSALPLIQQPATILLSPIPRINVGFNTFEHRSKSLAEQRGVAAHHSKVMAVKQAQLKLEVGEPVKSPPSSLQIKHPIQSYQVAPQQAKPLHPAVKENNLVSPKTNNQQLQTTYQSLPMSEIVSKQHTLYADSSVPSTKRIKKEVSAEDVLDHHKWASPQLDSVVMKQTNEGVITMRTYKIDEEQTVDVRLDTQGTLSAMGNTKDGFQKAINKKGHKPEQMQITTYQLEALESTGIGKNPGKHSLKKKTNLVQDEGHQRNSGMHKTLQDRHASQSSVLDQIMQLQDSVYQQTVHSRKGKLGPPSLQKGAIEISERLDDRSTLSPTELGFIQGPAYSPLMANIEAKTTIDLRVKPLQQNPNRPAIQQTTTIFPLDLPLNLDQNKRQKIKLERKTIIDSNKHSPKNPFETHKSTFQRERKSNHKVSNIEEGSEEQEWNNRSQLTQDQFLNTTVVKKSKWKDTNRQASLAYETGTVTPAPDQRVQDPSRLKRNSNPFVNHSNLLEIAQRFANSSKRNAPQSYHSEHTYQNAQNNSQYNSSYQYETATKEFRKQKITESAEKPTQLQIGGEGSPMLSLLPPLMTRDISPRYKSSIDKKNKANKQVSIQANLDQTQSLQKKNQLLPSSQQDTLQQSQQIAGSDLKSPSSLTQIGAGAFEIARSGSVSQQSNGQDDGIDTRLSTSNKKLQQSNDLFQPKMPKSFSIEQISVMINHQSINEMGDRPFIEVSQTLPQGDSFEILKRSRQDLSAQLISELTKQVHRDVVVLPEYKPMNQALAYHRRELNVDGTWKGRTGNMGDMSFLEYVNPKHFKNPLDSKNKFGFQTINPDRLLLLSKIDHVQTEVSPTQRRNSPKIHKDISLVGQRINASPQQTKQTVKPSEIRQPDQEPEYLMEPEEQAPETQHPTLSSQTKSGVAPMRTKLDFRFTSPISPRIPVDTNPFVAKVIGQSSQISLNSGSEGEFHKTALPKLNMQTSKEFLSTALLRYSPSSKLSKGQFGGLKQPKTSRKQDKQVQSQSDVSQ